MTFEELKEAGYVEHHRCAVCSGPVGYYVHRELAAAVFDSGCGCGPIPNERLITHDELASIEQRIAKQDQSS